MATLLIANPNGTPFRFFVPLDQPASLGRAADNTCAINHAHLSNHHAVISFDPAANAFVLKDLGSRNGTQVNGQKIQQVRLSDGDRIVFGILEGYLLRDHATPRPVPAPSAGMEPREAEDRDAVEMMERLSKSLIQKIDLVDDLLERYAAKANGQEVLADLQALKGSLKDLLKEFAIESYSFAPETEVDLEMRKKIEIVASDKAPASARASTKIVQTLHDGYCRVAGDKPVIVRKAHVTTCVAAAK